MAKMRTYKKLSILMYGGQRMCNNYAFINCNIIDGNLDSQIQDNMFILINEKGIIHKIGKVYELNIPHNYEVIDLGNKFVMPGLINAHVHLFASGKTMKITANESEKALLFKLLSSRLGKKLLKRRMKRNVISALNSGVTTLRSVGDFFYKDLEIREDIKNNKFLGPNLIVSGQMISVMGGHGAPYLSLIGDTPWEARECVRKNIGRGVDFIKICVTGGIADARMVGGAGRLQMTEEEVAAVCEEAHKIGLLVAAHVEGKDGLKVALRGGVDTIEHGSYMDDETICLFKNNPKSLRGYSALIPTLQVLIPRSKLNQSITRIDSVIKQNTMMVCDGVLNGLRQAVESGIKIGLGTDASMPYVTHYNTWRELEYVVKFAGASARQAIYFATKSNAEIMGIDKFTGSIDTGKFADFIVLKNNPEEDIRTLAEPYMVVARGNIINNPSVKKLKEIDDVLELV